MTDRPLSPGICSVTLRALGVDDVVRTAIAAGMSGIEWGSDVHVHDASSAVHARTATLAAGLRIMSLGSYYRAGSFGNFEGVLALATELGAPRIRVWAGDTGSAHATADQWDAVVEDTQRIARLAAARGTALAFEYHGGTLTDSADPTLELLRRVNRPNVGTYWQPAVGLHDGQVLESLRRVLQHVVGVHAFSWWPNTERLPLAARKYLWETVLDVLLANGKTMDIMLEFVTDDLPANVITDGSFLKHATLSSAPGSTPVQKS